MIAAPPDDQTSLTARQLNACGGAGRVVRELAEVCSRVRSALIVQLAEGG